MVNNDILFSITVEDMQEYAREKIGRELNEDELDIAKDGLEWGLMTGIDTVFNTIVTEMI